MSQALNGVSAVFALCATVFFVIGCAGYTETKEDLQNVPWITVDEDSLGLKVYFGLQAFRFEAGNSETQAYSGDGCLSAFCDRCEHDGRSAIGLLVISTVFAAVATVLSGALAASHNATTQLGNLFLSFVSAAFAIIGFGMFMGSCYMKIDEDSNFDLKWGAGSIITLLGLIMMFVVVVLQFGAVIVGGGSA